MPRFKQQNPRHITGSLLGHNQDEQVDSLGSADAKESSRCSKLPNDSKSMRIQECSQTDEDSYKHVVHDFPPNPELRKDPDENQIIVGSSEAVIDEKKSLGETSSGDVDKLNAETPENDFKTTGVCNEKDSASELLPEFHKQPVDDDWGKNEPYSQAISSVWNKFFVQYMNKMAENNFLTREVKSKSEEVVEDMNNNVERYEVSKHMKGKIENNNIDLTSENHAPKNENKISLYNMYQNNNMNTWKELLRYREMYLNSTKPAEMYDQGFQFPPRQAVSGSNMPNWMTAGGVQDYLNPNYANNLTRYLQRPHSYTNSYQKETEYANGNKPNIPFSLHKDRTLNDQESPPPTSRSEKENVSTFRPIPPYFPSPYTIIPDLRRNFTDYETTAADAAMNEKTGKITRSRPSTVHSIGDAIVREAKQQLKGVDPENMYIPCPICHKRIKRLYHFQRHMRIHSGEKSHHCPYCPYKSVRKDNLKSHMKTHQKHHTNDSKRAKFSSHIGDGKNYTQPREKIASSPSSRNMSFLEYSPSHGMFSLAQTNVQGISPPRFSPANSSITSSSPNSTPNGLSTSSPSSIIPMQYNYSDSNLSLSSENLKSPKRKSVSILDDVGYSKIAKLSDEEQVEVDNDNNSNNRSKLHQWTSRDSIAQVDTKKSKISQNLVTSRIESNNSPKCVESENTHTDSTATKKQDEPKNDVLFENSAKSPTLNSTNKLSPKPIADNNYKLKCRVCAFTTANMTSLQDHMQSHKESGYYKCSECNYHGKNLSKLIEHNRIHTGERPFQCDQCSYAAKRKDNLAQHKNVKHKIPFLTSSKQTELLNGFDSTDFKMNEINNHFQTSSSAYKSFSYPNFPSSFPTNGQTTKINPKADPENEININFSLSLSAPKYSWKDKDETIVKSERKTSHESNFDKTTTREKRELSPPPLKSDKSLHSMGNLPHGQLIYPFYPYLPQQQAMYPFFNLQQPSIDIANVLGYHQQNLIHGSFARRCGPQRKTRCSTEKRDSQSGFRQTAVEMGENYL